MKEKSLFVRNKQQGSVEFGKWVKIIITTYS